MDDDAAFARAVRVLAERDGVGELLRIPEVWDAVAMRYHDAALRLIERDGEEPGCACEGKGWDVYNVDEVEGYLGEIQACDDCRRLRCDDDAAEAARVAGYGVSLLDDEHGVTFVVVSAPTG